MKNKNYFKHALSRFFLILLLTGFAVIDVMAQVPRNIPQPGSDQGLDLQSPWHIIFLIVLPLFMIGYLIYTMMRKPKSEEENAETGKSLDGKMDDKESEKNE